MQPCDIPARATLRSPPETRAASGAGRGAEGWAARAGLLGVLSPCTRGLTPVSNPQAVQARARTLTSAGTVSGVRVERAPCRVDDTDALGGARSFYAHGRVPHGSTRHLHSTGRCPLGFGLWETSACPLHSRRVPHTPTRGAPAELRAGRAPGRAPPSRPPRPARGGQKGGRLLRGLRGPEPRPQRRPGAGRPPSAAAPGRGLHLSRQRRPLRERSAGPNRS